MATDHKTPSRRRRQQRAARAAGLPASSRHIFLCGDDDKQKCASRERLRSAWKLLKRRLDELGLADAGTVARTRTHCLRVCEAGPIAVVYPEGAWYGECDAERLERIVGEHLVGGRVVDDLLIVARPLAPDAAPEP